MDAGARTYLPASYYDQLHLPADLNMVESDVYTEAPRILPDRSATIVTYCSNEAAGNSQAVANPHHHSRLVDRAATHSSRPLSPVPCSELQQGSDRDRTVPSLMLVSRPRISRESHRGSDIPAAG